MFKLNLQITPPPSDGRSFFTDTLNIGIKGKNPLNVDCRGFYPRATTAPTVITDFGYTYDKNSNITNISFDHRSSTPPENTFTYDDLNRLTGVEYLSDSQDTESFTIDDLGNRTNAQLRGENSKSYDRNEETNRYDDSGTADISCSYDNAGNTMIDQDDYEYSYDYENRIIRIEDSSNKVAEFEYDALGLRIYKYDAKAYEDTYYYYNAAWQVLSEYDDSTHKMSYIYGNYIDEVLVRFVGSACKYFVHDHLYSPVALASSDGSLLERYEYEYDAYGNCTILSPTYDIRNTSNYENSYLFTGLEILKT